MDQVSINEQTVTGAKENGAYSNSKLCVMKEEEHVTPIVIDSDNNCVYQVQVSGQHHGSPSLILHRPIKMF